MKESFGNQTIGVKVAMALCLGGNDFYPKFHQISHKTAVKAVTENPQYTQKLGMASRMINREDERPSLALFPMWICGEQASCGGPLLQETCGRVRGALYVCCL